MNKTDNRKIFFKVVAMCLLSIFSLSSCLSSDDETIDSPECAITSFSIGAITSYVPAKTSAGNDTLVKRVISGSEVRFNIDQVNGHIYSVDSLTSWADLTKVVPSYTSTGGLYYKPAGEDLYYYITSGSDSIDFSKTVEVLCASYDGKSARKYTIDIYKSKYVSDTLEWTRVDTDLRYNGAGKPFYINGKVSLFAKNSEGKTVVTTSENGTTWSSEKELTGFDGTLDYASVLLYKNTFYGIDSEGYIYRSAEGTVWQKASDEKFERLLAADGINLYAFNGTEIVGTEDLTTWTPQGNTDLDMLPESCLHSFSYNSKTNANLNTGMMIGVSSNNTDNCVTWYKLSSKIDSANQPWAYIQVTNDNDFSLPLLANLSATYFNSSIWAIGSDNGVYKNLYCSYDNGISWHAEEKYPMPSDIDAANGPASLVNANGELWIIQPNGSVWKGSTR